MTSAHWIPADVSKEVRALLPLWLGCVAVVWAGGLPDDARLFLRAGFAMYVLGSLALGALSVGHEYTSRTLPLLLSLPISRRRLFAIKTSVLFIMLVVLAVIALARLPVTPAGREMHDTAIVGGMSFLGAAFLAPWLTMVCRNPIAGALFALSIPAGLLVGSEVFSIVLLGQVGTPAAERFRMEIFWSGMLLVSAVGGFCGWRRFLKLQVIDGPPADLVVPRWLSRSNTASSAQGLQKSSRVWVLLCKELHLQQLTFMVSILYVCAWAAILLTWYSTIMTIDQPFLILTVVHGAMIALLAGSIASAEERQLGTLDSQILLPMSAARQWLIKCGVVFGLVVVLGLALPALVGVLKPSVEPMRMNWTFAATVVVGAAVGLYASSLCSSGLKALLIAAPAAFVTLPALALCQAAALAVLSLGPWATSRIRRAPSYDATVIVLESAVLIVLLLRFAMINHRSMDSDVRRAWRQLGTVVGFVVLSVVAFTAAQMLFRR